MRKKWHILFALLQALLTAGVQAQMDVSLYLVEKDQWWQQGSANSVTPATISPGLLYTVYGPANFFAYVTLSNPASLTSASVTLPDNVTVKSLASDTNASPPSFFSSPDYTSQAALDAAFPNGNYKMTLVTAHDGTKNITLNLTGDLYLPSPPKFSNYNAAQSVNVASDFVVTWNPLNGGTTNDLVFFRVYGSGGNIVFNMSNTGPGALNGTSTSVLIPAGTLIAGQSYQAQVLFLRTVTFDSADYPGAFGIAEYDTITTMSLVTVPQDVTLYVVEKDQYWQQTSANSVTPATSSPGLIGTATGPVSFFTLVQLSTPASLTSASITLPDNLTVRSLSGVTNASPPSFFLATDYVSQSALDAAYPDGNYKMTMVTAHNGTKNITLNLSGDSYSPSPPKFSNYGAAQSVNSTSDFLLTWNPLTGGTTNDLVIFRIYGTGGNIVFSTPTGAGQLNGASTSVLIPAGTLSAVQNYQAQLLFLHTVTFDGTDYPGATGVADYATITTMSLATIGQDLTFYFLEKDQWWQQTGANRVSPATSSPGLFGNAVIGPASIYAEVDLSSPTSASSATLTLPDNVTVRPFISATNYSPPSFYNRAVYASQSALDAANPDGNYKLTFVTAHSGTVKATLNLSNDYYLPTPPRFSNYPAAQSVNAENNFTLNWDPLGGGTTNDVVVFIIYGTNGQTVYSTSNKPGALNGASTSILIPAGTLSPGRTYQPQLVFTRTVAVNTTDYPGATGVADFATITTMNLVTAPPASPVLSMARLPPSGPNAGKLQFQINGQDGVNYRIDKSTNLSIWTPLATNQTTGGAYLFIDSTPLGGSYGFYRAVAIP